MTAWLQKRSSNLPALTALALCTAMLYALVPVRSDASGVSLLLNTVAGTEPTGPLSATIESPSGIAVDSSGNVFFADTKSNVVRMVNTTDNTIRRVAGNGVKGYAGDGGLANTASLNAPKDVSVDASGNLYIADTLNYIVRKVNASDGKINTVAGTPGVKCTASGCAGDGGLATSAQFHNPYSVQFDDAIGKLYISDDSNNVVRVISGGNISRFAGDYTLGYSGDGGLATSAMLNVPSGLTNSPSGHVYFADYGNEIVRFVNTTDSKINRSAGSIAGMPNNFGYQGDGGPAASAFLNSPADVWYSASGMYFIADLENNAVRMVNTSDGIINTVAGTGAQGFSGGSATSAMLNGPSGVAYDDASGTLYISDTKNNRIRKVSGSVISTFAGNGFEGFLGDGGQATQAPLFSPVWTAVNAAGTLLYFSDDEGHQVRRVDLATGIITTIAGAGAKGFSGDNGLATSALMNQPAGLALDEATNTLYIADCVNDRVRKVNLATNIISTVAGTGVAWYSGDGGAATDADLWRPTGLALNAAGDLYIADSFNNVIRKVSGGVITRVVGSEFGLSGSSGDSGAATSARLNTPMGIWIQKSSNTLYIADEYNHRIRKVDLSTGIITTVAGTGTAGYSGDYGLATAALINGPQAVAVTPVGEIIIADTRNHAIRRIEPTKLTIATLLGNGTAGFAGDSDPLFALLYQPVGVAVAQSTDPKAALYIADSSNRRIRELKITNRAPFYPELVYPANGATNVNSPVSFAWENVSDLDGDTLTHYLYYCTDNTFADPSCGPTIVNPKPLITDLATGALGGIAVFAIGAIGIRRRKAGIVLAIALVAVIGVSCGGSSKSSTSSPPPDTTPPPPPAQLSQVSNALVANTTYYWRVKVEDGNGGVAQSAIWQFTTKP